MDELFSNSGGLLAGWRHISLLNIGKTNLNICQLKEMLQGFEEENMLLLNVVPCQQNEAYRTLTENCEIFFSVTRNTK